MKAALPSLRLIYVMRHPIDRLVSHYIHQWTQNVIRCGIDEAVDRYPELVNYGRYAYQLHPYFEAYGKASVLPVFFGRLKTEPQQELERIAGHIGYGDSVTWNEDAGAQNVSSERIRKFPGYQLLVDSAPMAFLRRRLVPQSIRDRVKSQLTMRERPTLSPATRARLEQVFDEDLATLSDWLGTSLTCQNFDEVTLRGPLDWSP
jgi:hypothetical protein